MHDRLKWMFVHGAGAAAFFFALQRWAMRESVETSLIWAAAGAIGAAWLAWTQTGR